MEGRPDGNEEHDSVEIELDHNPNDTDIRLKHENYGERECQCKGAGCNECNPEEFQAEQAAKAANIKTE